MEWQLITAVKSFITLAPGVNIIKLFFSLLLKLKPGANVIKLFTMVIYCCSMVMPSFCVIKLYYLGNYHGMTVNYHGIKLFYHIGEKSLL